MLTLSIIQIIGQDMCSSFPIKNFFFGATNMANNTEQHFMKQVHGVLEIIMLEML